MFDRVIAGLIMFAVLLFMGVLGLLCVIQEAERPTEGNERFMLLWYGGWAAAAWIAMGYYLRVVQGLISRG